MVQLLLDKGADVNIRGGRYNNALQAASAVGYDQVMQILLDKGADVNVHAGYYGNALQAASDRGHHQVVQMLLNKGADINAQGRRHGNALQAASDGGHDQVVQILLDKGMHCRRHQLEVILKWCRYYSTKEPMSTLKVGIVTHYMQHQKKVMIK